MTLLQDYSFITLIILSFFSFLAGFIDSVVGGGGLIQVPILLINFPQTPLATLLGTNKIAAISGTAMAAYRYVKNVRFDYLLLVTVSTFACIASYFGATLVVFFDSNLLKPIVFIILIGIAVYTWFNKDLGSFKGKFLPSWKRYLMGSILGLVVGFYDGFLGPGTGSFFVLGFVVLLGFEFLTATAYTKIINCITNISALVVFVKDGSYIFELGLLMAIFNIAGSLIGSNLAIKRGNHFIRYIFLVVVCMLIFKYGYDILIGYFLSN
jgi:uncharacterized membrane protein YfcA